MTDMPLHRELADQRGENPFWPLTAAALALLLLTLIWLPFEPRMVGDAPAAAKPAKFAASFVIHFATLALICGALSPAGRDARTVRLAGRVMAAAFIGEMAYITLQAARGVGSHFNFSSTFTVVAYSIMGVGAVLLIAMPVGVAWIARRDAGARLGPATRQGIWYGAVVSFALTLLTAGALSTSGGHFVGTPSPGAATFPITGWSAEVGDLRPAHFLALHALQAFPLAGLWIDRTGRAPSLLAGFAALWVAVTLAVFAQALAGLPLIRF